MKLSKAFRLSQGEVVALTGGGGKTTAMFRLAGELVQTPKRRILTTTSTRIFAAQIQHAPAYVSFNPEQQAVEVILPQLETVLAEYNQVLLIGQADPQSGKAFGVPPYVIDFLAATGRFDFIINEADGSRMRPFKAPAEHEPVIPKSTTLVVPVVGLDVLDRPLNDDTVHRAGRVSQLSDTALGQPITVDTIAAVIRHPEGGLKGVPLEARVIPLLNKLETQVNISPVRYLADKLLLDKRIEAVAIGSAQNSDRPVTEVVSRTAAIILAAGGASRFGSPKQLARWGEDTFIERAVDVALASQARPVIVVLGAEVEQSRAVLGDRPVKVVINREWAKGQSTSMKAGLAALPADINSAVFLLVDQPKVTSDIVDTLIQRHRETLAPIVWPEFKGRRGNPILFDRSLFSELKQITGDTGGRPLLQTYSEQAERVSVTDQSILLDIDRSEDLKNLKSA